MDTMNVIVNDNLHQQEHTDHQAEGMDQEAVHTQKQVSEQLCEQPAQADPLEPYHNHVNTEQEPSLKDIILPPKMRKKGRPKGAEMTVIGLPKKKKRGNPSALSFHKLDPRTKDKLFLTELTNPLEAQLALDDTKLLGSAELKPFAMLSDMLRDENFDIMRVEKYFSNEGWMTFLESLERKSSCKWVCSVCTKVITSNTDSLICERCLLWCHLPYGKLKKPPKAKWFCKCCRRKYVL